MKRVRTLALGCALWSLCLGCDRPPGDTQTAAGVSASAAGATAHGAAASGAPSAASPSASTANEEGPRPGYYLGRKLAPTMSHEGAPWLIREERDAEENTTLLHEQLRLKSGDVACDIGAGNGYHTLRMARAVAPQGQVVAVDIQPEMLRALRERAEAAKISNIETVLGEPADPKLPAGRCDLVLMVDVYHELSDPAAMLAQLRRALSPRGQLVLVEFREEDPKVPIKPLHKMSKAQIEKEMVESQLVLARSFDGLPWQHLLFYVPKGRAGVPPANH